MKRIAILTGVFSAILAGGLLGESREKWLADGRAAVERAKQLAPITNRAKNVILMTGDGMGVTTVTAARILEGQRRGEPGEENLLSFENLPYTALVKTYNTNQQTGDSAGCMTALVTGAKSKAGVLSVDQGVTRGDHASAAGHELRTILEMAEMAGLSTGVVTNTRVTDATPAACFAHTPERKWEDDAALSDAARDAGFKDVARQLLEFPYGDGLEVVLGGARNSFLPNTAIDPEYSDKKGHRRDGRDLTEEWLKRSGGKFVWNASQFAKLNLSETRSVLGLFDRDAMKYEVDRASDVGGEPSLSEMTSLAIDMLARNDKGYFLMVEGGLIDHAHHAGNASRALSETIEFANAVKTAIRKTDRRETLIIVTADHSHVFTMCGYPTRGNPILGLVRSNQSNGEPATGFKLDALGLPFTTLGYANGSGYIGASASQPEGIKRFPHDPVDYKAISKERPDLTQVDVSALNYLQECTVPLADETHGGEDVPLYADGPNAHLFRGVLEQNVIFHVMVDALGITGS